ncbi:thrombospondin type 3 repeat-containing protein [Paraliomyxa miuraensis]|uniref:thrombospondin type 3 repeat-containing protein n=1 Tax=Paraliomyxa miuraensis TaxID=376150 RepID=UPI002250B5E9|nr:thrombospondin type 3 repeat-containing protein [Paraliomyxa miuraensis]MCX4246267.1 thrombospondin type 3 repeat-containing protein [Paraliomyxa miuraensis]
MKRLCMMSNTPAAMLALGVVTVAITLGATEGEAEAAVAYIRSNVGAPWGESTNEQAMDLVFGAGGWDDLRYETVNPATLFSPAYGFIYMEGSDSNASELQAFLTANQAALQAWVSAGGDLFLNAAPNEGGNQNWGFGGVTLHYNDSSVNPGSAINPAHQIWNGPFLPTSPGNFTGGAFAHATVSGPGLIGHIQDANGGNPHLAELPAFGAGRIMFGGLTTSNFWTPTPEALNLRANVIAYLAGDDTDMDGIIDGADNCPEVMNPMQEDGDMDGLGDACDPCPLSLVNDADDDMACDDVDNCLGLANPDQLDDDMDGLGNACDECPLDPDDDLDNDTLCADVDNCPAVVNINQADDDMDGVGNLCDDCPDDTENDPDMDGVCAVDDNCPDVANDDQADADGDGIGDACDDVSGDSSGGEPDTSSVDGSGGSNPDTGLDSDTGGGTSGGINPTTGGLTGAGDDGATTSGCGCTSGADERRGPWCLMLAGGFALRRRRRVG